MKIFLLLAAVLLFPSCMSVQSTIYDVEIESAAIQESEEISEKTIRIVQISDFHSGDFGKNEQKLIQKIRSANPDLIMLTGDIFDFEMKAEKPTENVKRLLEGIRTICPFFYVSGNHEYFFYHEDEWSFLVSDYGGTVLKNDAVTAESSAGSVIVAGVSDPMEDLTVSERKKNRDNRRAYEKRLNATALKAAEEKEAHGDFLFSVLLAHRPEYIELYKRLGFDIVLSGHAHGGQWRFPLIAKNGLYAPNQGLFPKWTGGKFVFQRENARQTAFIISRGLSYQHPKLPRILNNPELVIIDVRLQ